MNYSQSYKSPVWLAINVGVNSYGTGLKQLYRMLQYQQEFRIQNIHAINTFVYLPITR